ncbi:MAG TPA: hypothetical protein ENF48_00140 [Desulfobacteraceae bacterium]|nr:hypothetical protein [Desulfobacteraceae bacterium]
MSGSAKRKSRPSLLLRNASDLMKHKSVRATFQISPESIEALSFLSTQLGLKQKSLFDHLLEDTDSLLAIARSNPKRNIDKKSRIQKTFVISQKSLSSLEKILSEVDASRDDLVEFAIRRLLPILAKERNQQKKRENTLAKIEKHFEHSIELLVEIEKTVGKNDPLYDFYAAVIKTYRNAFDKMEDLVEKGKRISKLELSKFEL